MLMKNGDRAVWNHISIEERGEYFACSNTFKEVQEMANQRKAGAAKDLFKDYSIGGGEAGQRSGKGGKAGGGLGGMKEGGIKGGGKRKTHVGRKKGSPGGLTSD
jgi:hypothetical protein